MTIEDSLTHFDSQLGYEPVLEGGRIPKKTRFVLCGMGGSRLAGDILKVWDPYLPIVIHSDYGLPALSQKDLKESLVIINSYSGNTEEVLDGLKVARVKKLSVVIIASGGKLITQARTHHLPHIIVPNPGLEPRMATAYSVAAVLKAMGRADGLRKLHEVSQLIEPLRLRKEAEALSRVLIGHVPLVYASHRNNPLGYIWKIAFNETAKIPSFCNRFPELNHNEMTGFDIIPSTKLLSHMFLAIFLKDHEDDPRIGRRMAITQKLFRERGLLSHDVSLSDHGFEKIFSSVLLAEWTAYFLAMHYKTNPDAVPMVEEFKQLIA